MSITYQSKVEDGILIITTTGRDDNVNQVIEYGRSITQLAVNSGVIRILCDERNLEYAIGTLDIFVAAKKIAEEVPKLAYIAIVCQPRFLKDGKFWETVAVNRGLRVHIGTDIRRAEDWIKARDI